MKTSYSGFKKVSSDHEKTTFRRNDGHELHVAHKSLSKKMKAELDKLPHYEDGGGVESDYKDKKKSKDQRLEEEISPEEFKSAELGTTQDPNFNPGENETLTDQEAINSLGQNQTAQSAPPPMETAAPVQTPQAVPVPQQAAAPASGAMAPAAAPPQPIVQSGQDQSGLNQYGELSTNIDKSRAEKNLESLYATGAHLGPQDQKWKNDLENGHIEPKTYHDLFAKNSDGSERGTLSKIGSLFGLLLSGAGAGLAHQENMVMKMMDNEIAKDLEAQKQSKTNAYNMLSLAQHHEMQRAGINHQNAETNILANATATMHMNRAAVDEMARIVKKLSPTDPKRMEAEQKLAIISQNVDAKNLTLEQQAIAKIQLLKAAGVGTSTGYGTPANLSEERYKQLQNVRRASGDPLLMKKADDDDSKHVAGIPGFASTALDSTQKTELRNMDQFNHSVQRVRDWAKKHSGMMNQLNVADRNYGKTLLTSLKSIYQERQNMGGLKQFDIPILNQEIGTNLMSVFNSLETDPKLKSAQDTNLDQFNEKKKGYGFPIDGVNKPESTKPGGSSNAQAEAWARANPKDPRSAKILKTLGK